MGCCFKTRYLSYRCLLYRLNSEHLHLVYDSCVDRSLQLYTLVTWHCHRLLRYYVYVLATAEGTLSECYFSISQIIGVYLCIFIVPARCANCAFLCMMFLRTHCGLLATKIPCLCRRPSFSMAGAHRCGWSHLAPTWRARRSFCRRRFDFVTCCREATYAFLSGI